MADTAITPVQNSPQVQFSPQELEEISQFKEMVFAGTRWSGWELQRNGDETATLALIYAAEPEKPIGFYKRISISSVASPLEHLEKLRESVLEFVEEFAAANMGLPTLEITTLGEDPMFDESPMTRAGRIKDALSEAAPITESEPEVTDDDGHPLSTIEAERIRNEVMVQEFGTPQPSLADVIKDGIKRRFS